MQMNWVDLCILLLLLLFALDGIRKTFLSESLDFIAFLFSFFFALWLYNPIAHFFLNQFQIPLSLANVLGFVTIWFIAESILFALIKILLMRSQLARSYNGHLDKFAFLPGMLRGLVFVTIILVMVASFPIQPQIKVAVESSHLGTAILGKAHQLEGPLKSVFGGLTQDTMTFFTVKPKSDESVDLGFSTDKFTPNPALETQMISLVNEERKKVGLGPLTFDQKLQTVARGHSEDMFKRGYFSHHSPENKSVVDRAENQDVAYLVIGENLAYAPNLELAHNGLMNSTGHRANILSPDFHKVGIGIMDGKVYGLMVTQVFSN